MAMRRDPRIARDYKAAVRARQGGTLSCEACGWTVPAGLGSDDLLHAHHVVPLARDGRDGEWNLVVLCPNDHALAHRIWEERAAALKDVARGWPYRLAEKRWKFDRSILLARLQALRAARQMAVA